MRKCFLQIFIERPTPGDLQQTFDTLHALEAAKGWTVIRNFRQLPDKEESFVGIKKGPLILELAEPPDKEESYVVIKKGPLILELAEPPQQP